MNPYRRDTFLNQMLAGDGNFIGLRDELESLLDLVSQPRPAAVSLVGPLGIGKSFLLRYLAAPQGARQTFPNAIGQSFRDDHERLLCVLVDLEACAANELSDLFGLLYTHVLGSLAMLLKLDDARLVPLDRLAFAAPPTVAELRTLVRQALQSARREMDDDELRERFDRAVGTAQPAALLELLRRLDLWGIRVVLLLDDFDLVAAQLRRADYDHLRVLVGVTSLVIATRQALSTLIRGDANSSPFFNLVQRLNLLSLHFFTPEEGRRLITEPPTWFADTQSFRFSASDVDFILELTGLHPDLIRASCETLYLRYRRRSSGSDDLLPEAERPYIRAMLRAPFTDFFTVLWRQIESDDQTRLLKIARDENGIASPVPINELSNLIGRGYIVYERGRFRVFAGLFRDFVLEQDVAKPAPPAIGTLAATVTMTELEIRFLDMLKAKPGDLVSREDIIAALYPKVAKGQDTRELSGRLDALVFRLRGKLDREPVIIENVRGQGYRLVLTRT